MTLLRIALTLILFVASAASASSVELRLFAEGLTAPIAIADPNDGTGRLFVLEQQGVVRALDASGALSTPLLELTARLIPLEEGFEARGLLGFALHLDFARNGRVSMY
jgi:glucose/arabinose dehydrogenase